MKLVFARLTSAAAILFFGGQFSAAQQGADKPLTTGTGNQVINSNGSRNPGPATSNQQNQNQQRTSATTGENRGHDPDRMIAGLLALGNEEEAIIGHFASSRAQNEEVKKF